MYTLPNTFPGIKIIETFDNNKSAAELKFTEVAGFRQKKLGS